MNDTQKNAVRILIAGGMDPFEAMEVIGGNAPTVEAPAAKVDGRNHEARKANYDKRIARRESTPLGGLTKRERQALAAILREELGREFTKAEWSKAVRDYKAGKFTIEF